METEPVYWVDYESEHFTFRAIRHAAEVLRGKGEEDEAQGFSAIMAGTLLAHTAYEGFVNDLIERLYKEPWQTARREHRGTMGKTLFLATQLGVSLKRAERPYRSVAELDRWRSDLVHPQTARRKGVTSAKSYAKNPVRARPDVFIKLERPTFVARCFDDTSALADLILKAAAKQYYRAVRDLGTSALEGHLGIGGASYRPQGSK